MSEAVRPPLPWPVAVVISSIVASLSIASFFPLLDGSLGGFITRGPAAVDPDIGDHLAVLLDPTVIFTAQRVIHIVGLAAFLAVAFVLLRTRLASPAAPLAATTLVCLAAALFAPIEGLPSGPTLAKLIGSVTQEGLPGFWGSLTGVSTLAFLATFPEGRWNPRWTVVPVSIGGALLILTSMFGLDVSTWSPAVHWTTTVALAGPLLVAQAARLGRQRGPALPVVVSLAGGISAFALLAALRPELQTDSLGLVLNTPRLQAVYATNLVALLTASVFAFPGTVGMAIFRHRLFDLDRLVNRALVYATMTGLIGAMFLGLVALVVAIAQAPLSDQSGYVGILLGAVVVVTFQPLRRQVQRSVDRRFFRSRYDARQVIDGFGREVRQLVDPERLEESLRATVQGALGPTYTTIHRPGSDELRDLIDLPEETMLLDGEVPAVPGRFGARGAAVLVPLHAGGALSGLIELGRRTSGSRYSSLDLDLLDQLARGAGPALQLAHEVRARERDARERERMSHELELAAKIQRDLLPHGVPDIPGWTFAALYRPAREVGGDFYDWIELDDGRVSVVIGDVSDKGIPAALVMATCRTLLRVSATTGRSPGDVLAEVNDRLVPDIPPAMFVTCLLATIDPDSGDVVVANAGHNLPLKRGADQLDEIVARGMPLGLMPSMVYDETKTHLEPAESLVLSSDGVTEAHGPDMDMFGTARMSAAVMHSGEDVIGATLRDHARFVGPDWEQEDDVTLVVVGRKPL